jgi:hypothetical protein
VPANLVPAELLPAEVQGGSSRMAAKATTLLPSYLQVFKDPLMPSSLHGCLCYVCIQIFKVDLVGACRSSGMYPCLQICKYDLFLPADLQMEIWCLI